MAADATAEDFRRRRNGMIKSIAVAFVTAAALWCAVYFLSPPLDGMAAPVSRLIFALKCICAAVLFCFVTGVEAVAHERLDSPAIDPLAGYETRRMRINLRYLQHTLEQFAVFISGLLGLAVYCPGGSSMRAVAATTVVWIVFRFAFWIGYHRGPLHRAAGAPGMALSMLVLLYVVARFADELAGTAGAAVAVIAFFAIEAFLFRATRHRPAEPAVSSEIVP